MKVFMRQGSAAQNLQDLLPVVNRYNERWFALCTDDMNPAHLLEKGSIDHLLRLAVATGMAPITALRMATLNPAEHYRLMDRGVLAPGRRADLLVVDNLATFEAQRVYLRGELVAQHGRSVVALQARPPEVSVYDTVHVAWPQVDFRIPAQGSRIRAIGVIPDQLVTKCRILPARIIAGEALADPERDLLKMAVIERHHASGRMGQGFVTGLGMKRGAMASTVAHDHHNLLVVGADDRSMLTAARAVVEAGGGQAVALGGEVMAMLPLPIAGIMTDVGAAELAAGRAGIAAALRELGCAMSDPIFALSLAITLVVIPALKMSNRGLVDVMAGEIVELFV